MKESTFQKQVIKELKEKFKNCVVLKNDPTSRQGVPDLTIFHEDKWACLEVKVSAKAHKQPNQDYWVQKMDEMSYAAFIYPENKEEVYNELEQLFSS